MLQQPLVVTKATKAAVAVAAPLPATAPAQFMHTSGSSLHLAQQPPTLSSGGLHVDPNAQVNASGQQSLKLSLSLASLRGKNAPGAADEGKSASGFKFVI